MYTRLQWYKHTTGPIRLPSVCRQCRCWVSNGNRNLYPGLRGWLLRHCQCVSRPHTTEPCYEQEYRHRGVFNTVSGLFGVGHATTTYGGNIGAIGMISVRKTIPKMPLLAIRCLWLVSWVLVLQKHYVKTITLACYRFNSK